MMRSIYSPTASAKDAVLAILRDQQAYVIRTAQLWSESSKSPRAEQYAVRDHEVAELLERIIGAVESNQFDADSTTEAFVDAADAERTAQRDEYVNGGVDDEPGFDPGEAASLVAQFDAALAAGRAMDDEEAEEPLAVGDVLTGGDPEPPPGTVVQLGDGQQWKRLLNPRTTYRRWQWVATTDNADQPHTRWQWARVTFDGPVIVREVPVEARVEYVDYAEAADVREIEREMAIEAGDDSEADRQVAEDDARFERSMWLANQAAKDAEARDDAWSTAEQVEHDQACEARIDAESGAE